MCDDEGGGVVGYKEGRSKQDANLKEVQLSKQKFRLNRCASVGSRKF